MQNVLVIGERKGAGLRKTALEALGAGRALAAALGSEAHAALVGHDLGVAAGEFATHGAAVVHVVDDAAYSRFASETYTAAIVQLVRDSNFGVVLFADTSFGKDLAPAVATRLGGALATDVVSLATAAGGGLTVVHPIYTGKVNAEFVLQGKPVQVVSLRPNIFPAATGNGQAGRIEAHAIPVTKPPRAVVREVVTTATGRVELSEADIVVSGGRSLKSAENFAILEQLAEVLGAAVGASRAAVDAGYQPHSRQVGQTGRVVNPSLYMAFGISGAIQHLVGMRTSKVIVAVNKDPNAPIFQNADYGIVGDLFEVVPALTSEFGKLLGKS